MATEEPGLFENQHVSLVSVADGLDLLLLFLLRRLWAEGNTIKAE